MSDAGDTDIHQLDEDTVARIAAGEVVERPASAVKELVENSLDADATRIDVTVESGGTELIRVADDGQGMSEADLRAAVRQHTTSKIADLDDLEGGVTTLGFRGEALHTIGSVSRLRIRSRPRASGSDGESAGGRTATAGGGAGAVGTELVYEGGTVTNVEPAGCPEGTTVEVTDLFYNTPARRKFLKTTATEFAHVNRVVTRYALANPDVAISLTHDGREVFATTGQDDLQAAVLSVYGREVAASMIAVEASGDDLPPGPVESVSGLVSHPETNRSTREYLATYVNGRAITADAIREGIVGAYGTQLGTDRYPFVVCFLSVPGEAVDVNVHPRKREVRFDDADAVRRQVDSAVESALLEHGLLRSGAPRGRSKPDETQVEPESPGRRADERGAPAAEASERDDGVTGRGDRATGHEDPASPPGSVTAAGGRGDERDEASQDPAADGRQSKSTNGATGGRVEPTTDDGAVDAGESADSATATDDTESPDSAASTESAAPVDPERAGSSDESADVSAIDAGPTPPTGTNGGGARSLADQSRKFDVATDQRTLTGDVAEIEGEYETLPRLRVLGQLHDTYFVCETPDGLALIDQHAADERVNYERLQRAVAENPAAQALADPVELELTAAESAAFADVADALSQLGFRADRVEERTIAVTAVPAVFDETLDPAQLRDVLAAIVTGDGASGAETVDAMADEFLGDLACYPSITGNTSLHEGSVRDLLDALDDCRNPYACPHGRPVIVHIDETEIEDRFERDYPGHGG
ncbi:DNA mismatch repair protein mutL [Halovivax asiaticus JCM 14624]|uniref:DNA mismatch repair protein MutL n=1 Tax=Halovivax asiaticus JCM 14624 TaxID=1227490 RepID=M0BP26_9EURY|nr:DNA mismatch repair endonuclease MutL [Halovivax asiaticus]ELZ12237.1 DNA mismatch repair protein mutL [Halovivax asiaticus JCM 14624]